MDNVTIHADRGNQSLAYNKRLETTSLSTDRGSCGMTTDEIYVVCGGSQYWKTGVAPPNEPTAVEEIHPHSTKTTHARGFNWRNNNVSWKIELTMHSLVEKIVTMRLPGEDTNWQKKNTKQMYHTKINAGAARRNTTKTMIC